MSTHKFHILIGDTLSPLEEIAVNDLMDCLEKIQGERPLVENRKSSSGNPKFTFIFGTPDTHCLVKKYTKTGVIDMKELGKEGFVIKTILKDGRKEIILAGLSERGAMYSVYQFLEKYCSVGFFPDGDYIPRAGISHIPDIDERFLPAFKYRVFSTHPYWTAPYIHCSRLWTFEEWKRQIDWMRKKKFNVLNPVHDEGCYMWGETFLRAFPEIKREDIDLSKYERAPIDRENLNKQVFDYARENGLCISYNFMYSQVPSFFKSAYPDLIYHEMAMDSLGICASQPECKDVMKRLYGKITETYGLDEEHLYFICPYQHERELCKSFNTRAKPASQAYEVIKEIDPKANIYFENWCWNWDKQPAKEWEAFNKHIPEDAGIADWDSSMIISSEASEKIFNWYKPRKWMILDHITGEGFYPPAFVGGEKPADLIKIYRQAAQRGASGLMVFNIMAQTNELGCSLAADLGWDLNINESSFIEQFAGLRFGRVNSSKMGSSLESFIQSIDDDLRISAESWLAENKICRIVKEDGDIHSYIRQLKKRYSYAQEAVKFAEECKRGLEGNTFYQKYINELEFIINRFEGIFAFCDMALNRRNNEVFTGKCKEVMSAFNKIEKLYKKDLSNYSMKELFKVKGKEYSPSFKKNRQETTSRFWRDMSFPGYIVWEDFGIYEKKLMKLCENVRGKKHEAKKGAV